MADLIRELEGGATLTAFKESLAKIPTAANFQSSHFGEIAACLFAEDVLGFKRIYSKLSTLTAENANGFKMDLLLYDPATDPIELILGEVKSSEKVAAAAPAKHDRGCYAKLFNSLREYGSTDMEFDLAAVKDNLHLIPEPNRSRLRAALKPYTNPKIRYAGFVVIDDGTFNLEEAALLGTRRSNKTFDVDLIGVDGYAKNASSAYERLTSVLESVRKACS
jgi:hypothetical protein